MKSTMIGCTLAVALAAGCLPKNHYEAGMAAMRAAKYPEAQHELAQVAPTDYRYQESQFTLGLILYALHDPDGALKQMLSARSLSPENFEKLHAMIKGLGLLHGELTRLWRFKTESLIEEIDPAGEVLITVSRDGVLAALDPKQDKTIWEQPLGPRGNYGRAIPVIDGGLVYVVKEHFPEHKVLALKLGTGELVWSQDVGSHDDFANLAVAGDAVYVGEDDGHNKAALVALDKRTGRKLWSVPSTGMPNSVVASGGRVCTHTRKNHVLCVTSDGHKTLVDYELAGQVTQTQMTMTAANLFVSLNDSLYALQFSGPPLAWKQTIQEGGLSAAGLVDHGKKLVVQTRQALHAFDTQSGKALWLVSSPSEDGAWNRAAQQPIEVGGRVVGWGKSFVFGVSLDGRLSWQLAVDGSLTAAPTSLDKNTLVLAVHGSKSELVANSPRGLFD